MRKGKHISLMPLEANHLDRTRQWANDIDLNAGILRVLPVSDFTQKQWYENLCRDNSKIVFAVTLLANGQHIGNCGFYNIDFLHRRAELWLLIGEKEHWRKGYGREIVQLLLAFGFQSLNVNRIYLHVREDSYPAVKLYETSGFKKEGVMRSHYFIQGQYLDVQIMSILREDYVSKK